MQFFHSLLHFCVLPCNVVGRQVVCADRRVISGHVADSTGAVIPDANVTLTNVGTGAERSTVTTGAGDYTFPDVPPAIYKIQVTHAGFKTADQRKRGTAGAAIAAPGLHDAGGSRDANGHG